MSGSERRASGEVVFKQAPASAAPLFAVATLFLLSGVVFERSSPARLAVAVGVAVLLIAAGAVALLSTLTLAGDRLSYWSVVYRWSVDLGDLVSVEAPATPEPGSVTLRGMDGRRHRLPIRDYSGRADLAAALLQAVHGAVLSNRAQAELQRLRSDRSRRLRQWAPSRDGRSRDQRSRR